METSRPQSGSATNKSRPSAERRSAIWYADEAPLGPTLLPEMPSLGRAPISTLRLDRARTYDGTDIFELAFVSRGGNEWRIRDGTDTQRLVAGDLLVAGPNWRPTDHSRAATPGEICWLTLRRDPAAGLPGLSRAETDEIGTALTAVAGRVLRGTPAMPSLFGRLADEHRLNDRFAPLAARGALHSLIAEILRAATGAGITAERPAPSERIAAIMAMIDERLAEPLRVTQLAASAHLGLGQFHARFLAETGHTPADYRARRRLSKAQELLAEPDLTITDIALTLGFSTSQYFATFFRRFTGLSPRDFRDRPRPV
jgi:AraC family L-rhamnose operon regulatory protein RhaS